jgi:hypothetical protein
VPHSSIDSLLICVLQFYYVDSNASPSLLNFPLPYVLFKSQSFARGFTLYPTPSITFESFHLAMSFSGPPYRRPVSLPRSASNLGAPSMGNRLEVAPEDPLEETTHRCPPGNQLTKLVLYHLTLLNHILPCQLGWGPQCAPFRD